MMFTHEQFAHVSIRLALTALCMPDCHAEVVLCILVQAWAKWKLLHCSMR